MAGLSNSYSLERATTSLLHFSWRRNRVASELMLGFAMLYPIERAAIAPVERMLKHLQKLIT
jgi:hypothetical protein